MANKLPSFLVFLLLLAFQEMIMRGEAATCEAKSKLFEGACLIRSKNCGSICEKEGFMGGHCKFWRCVCYKDCGSGTPTQGPPLDMPVEGPTSDLGQPSEGEPGEGLPSDGQPGEDPPTEGQPGEGPPGEEMPPAKQS